ncbi:hypothetical protein BV25DRAFT_1855702 [Artomyces pyxidatus]|uniref:Uncharacterized protein n=1 Tax=Artomyces pyxidatus TaxID=48021 RepID=A0ACB8T144_9AGAM|nr:hypothetical protein BV25DRAFT_1855702 [Artomyces pyxidatus]
MESGLPKPDKRSCAKFGESETINKALRRCGKCRTVPYCSVECQKLDWKEHKNLCNVYIADGTLRNNGIYVGEKGPKVPKGEIKRTRGDILQDLMAYARSHNGDTLNVAVWTLLDLTKDISRAKTHFLAMTLRRTRSRNPRNMYRLIEVEVLPLQALQDAFSNRAHLGDMMPVNPIAMLEKDAQERMADGGLGSAMVMSVELPLGDDRPPHDAIKDMAVHILQPLGLYEDSRASMLRFEERRLKLRNPLPLKDYHLKCISNSLAGGQYSIVFVPHEDWAPGLQNSWAPEPPAPVWM